MELARDNKAKYNLLIASEEGLPFLIFISLTPAGMIIILSMKSLSLYFSTRAILFLVVTEPVSTNISFGNTDKKKA